MRIEATFRIEAALLGQDPDENRFFDWSRTKHGHILAVGVNIDGTEDSLVTYWQHGQWSPLRIEGD